MQEPDGRYLAASLGFGRGSIQIRGGGFDDNGGGHAALEELECQCANAAADVEERALDQPALGEAITQQTRRGPGALSPITFHFLGNFLRREVAFGRIVELVTAARHGYLFIIIPRPPIIC